VHPRAAGAVQAKSAISNPGDECEQEADRISEDVVRLPEQQPDREHERSAAKRAGTGDLERAAVPPVVREALRSPGQPLDAATLAFAEPRFGYDFSRVRVHTGATAQRSAADAGARAYTVGHDIVFGAGQYAPATDHGRKLVAHELTHVVQQQSGLRQPGTTLRSPVRITGTAPGVALQRQPATTQRSFTPTSFSDGLVLITAVVKDSPREEDLAGACRYLNALPMAGMLSLASRIAARRPGAVTALLATARQGWATSSVRAALAAVAVKGQISRVGFEAEQTSGKGDLAALSAPDAEQVLDVLGPAVPEVTAMRRTKGFQALRPDEQLRLTYLIGGSTSLSAPAVAALRTVLADRHSNKDDPVTFRTFLADEKYLRYDVRLPGGMTLQRAPFTVGPAVDIPKYAFGGQGSLTADAVRQDVVIDAKDAAGQEARQTIPVFRPKSAHLKDKSFGVPTIREVAETLAAAPPASRSKIAHVDIHFLPASNVPATGTGPPDDTAETVMASGADGVVNVYPAHTQAHDRRELAVDLIHETGHTASIAAWGNSATDDRWKPWREAMKADGMVVSSYGKETLDEDFAESWALYIPVLGTPREAEVRALIPARCKQMDTLLAQKPVAPSTHP
jgi:Domain of unknown function (DUF4157)